MQTIKLSVNQQIIRWQNPSRKPVAGSKGHVYIWLEVDSEWDGLTVLVTFEPDSREPISVLWTGEPLEVPPEVLHAGWLRIGLEGIGDDGRVVIPTAWMERPILVLPKSISEGREPESTTPELWEQVLSAIGTLSDLDTLDKSNLVAAINEVRRTGGGGGGGMAFDIDGETLIMDKGVLRVNTVNAVEEDSKQPITSGAVYTEFGKIVALLETI